MSTATGTSENAGRGGRGKAAGGPLHRMHPMVFRTVFGAFLWFVAAGFAGFAADRYSTYVLAVATVLLTIYLTIPSVLEHIRRHREGRRRESPAAVWLDEYVGTEPGPMKGRDAFIQAAIGPVSAAVGMTALAIVLLSVT